MNKLHLSGCWIVLVATALTGCVSEKNLLVDRDTSYDIGLRQTYSWEENKDVPEETNPFFFNTLNDKRIREAVDHELEKKGYEAVQTEPDLTVHYHIVTEDVSYSPSQHAHLREPIRRDLSPHQYEEGTLIIDLTDRASGQLVWRGIAFSAMGDLQTGSEMERQIRRSVEQMLRELPASRLKTPRELANEIF